MSVKSLQGRRTENTLLVLSYTMYDCRNRWCLRCYLCYLCVLSLGCSC